MGQFQDQEQQHQQSQYRQIRPTQTVQGKQCTFCGATMPQGVELCPNCGKPANPNMCTFCGAMMEPEDKFCPECGNPRDGIPCPQCGTLNFRSFCRTCNQPLDHMAQQAIEEAQHDPKFQRMLQLQQRMVELEKQILESVTELEEGETEEQPIELSEEDKALMEEFNALYTQLSGGVPPQNPATPDNPQPKEEAPKRTRLTISLQHMREIAQEYQQNVQQMNEIMEDLAPDPGSTPQVQRNYFCARKLPVITVTRSKQITQRPVEWICNYCGCHHQQPSDCVEPQLGGTWVYQNIEVETVITQKNWVTE